MQIVPLARLGFTAGVRAARQIKHGIMLGMRLMRTVRVDVRRDIVGALLAHARDGKVGNDKMSSESEFSESSLSDEELDSLRQAAKDGDTGAQVELAARLATGDGVAQDLESAADLYKQAAEADSPEGFYNLALMTLFGEGVEKNLDEAVRLLFEAIDCGSSDACLVIAEAYETGKLCLSIDYEKAVIFYLKSALFGSIKGIRSIRDLLIDEKIDSILLSKVFLEFE
ncbi:MAG: hypothetical protein B0D88_01905 [Candidatus Sedimenticola endophacoides]|nr:MAG: hypothetical protein B0D88_01905 [Candidatus Sedimenticola endophacoides]